MAKFKGALRQYRSYPNITFEAAWCTQEGVERRTLTLVCDIPIDSEQTVEEYVWARYPDATNIRQIDPAQGARYE